jgi:O-antigen/teichoic acid export membrane protein
MQRFRRSILFSFLDRYATFAIMLLLTALVARLLTPAEVGVFAISMGLVAIVEALREFGVGAYLVQERELTPEKIRTAFTVMLFLSLLLAGALYVLAGPIARFYGEPGVKAVLRLTVISFLLVPFSNPIMALLRRDMAFGWIALINLAGAITNLVVVLTLAVCGFGYMSLAWGAVASGAAIATAAVLCRPQPRLFRPCFVGWRQVLSFGGYASTTTLLNVFHDMLPQFSLGRILGFDAVGLYSRALMLCRLPDRLIMSALPPVLLPALSARARLGGDLKEAYLRGLGHGLTLQWPVLVCLALLADPAVRVLLGVQWAEAVPVVRIMALALLVMFPAFLTYPMLIALGRVKDTLIASLISLPPSMILVSAATFLGLEAVAASLFLTAPFQVYVALRFIRRQVPFTWTELGRAVRKGVAVTLCAAIAPAAAVGLAEFRFDLSVSAGAMAGVGAAAGWLVGLYLTDHPLLTEIPALSRLAANGFGRARPSLREARRSLQT